MFGIIDLATLVVVVVVVVRELAFEDLPRFTVRLRGVLNSLLTGVSVRRLAGVLDRHGRPGFSAEFGVLTFMCLFLSRLLVGVDTLLFELISLR